MSSMAQRLALAAIFSCPLIAAVHAQDVAAEKIVVTQAWSRATPGGSRVAGGYLTIENKGATPDRLVSGSTEAAKKLEIHQMALTDGVIVCALSKGA